MASACFQRNRQFDMTVSYPFVPEQLDFAKGNAPRSLLVSLPDSGLSFDESQECFADIVTRLKELGVKPLPEMDIQYCQLISEGGPTLCEYLLTYPLWEYRRTPSKLIVDGSCGCSVLNLWFFDAECPLLRCQMSTASMSNVHCFGCKKPLLICLSQSVTFPFCDKKACNWLITLVLSCHTTVTKIARFDSCCHTLVTT